MALDPIVRSLHVPLNPGDAFRLFTLEMRSWWPLDTHSRAEEGQKVEDVVFEGHVGGRIYEIMTDGSEGYWGTVVAWEPGARVVFDWRPSDEDRPHTQVEVRFSPGEDGGTLVDLEHRGWEALGPDLGAKAREAYDAPEGWGLVFHAAYARAAGA
jgi:uncharacterized protein YndB with AHSA1/START domain